MRIFELYFNPKTKEDRLFDSFIYEPTSFSEKNLGNLYMVGEIINPLPQSSNLLNNLSEVIKRKYYTLSHKNPSKAISESLKEANIFLSEEIKKENVSWLGNLNFSVFSLKDYNLSFTSTGNLKIILIRGGQINDIGKSINSGEIEPYPLKIFFNVVSGKMMEKDILLVLTEEIFDFLKEKNVLDKISQAGEIDEKNLKDILPQRIFNEGLGKEISGVCFMAYLEEDKKTSLNPYQGIGKKAKEMIFEKPKESFFESLGQKTGNIKSFFKGVPHLKKKEESIEEYEEIPTEKEIQPEVKMSDIFKAPDLSKIKDYSKRPNIKNQLILIAAFIGILFIGFLVFKNDARVKQDENQKFLEKIEEKLKTGENLIKDGKGQEASILLKEALNEITPFSKDKKSSLYPETESIKNSIEENLGIIYKLQSIEEPEVYIDLNPNKVGFIAQNMSFLDSVFYFSSPVSNDLYSYNKKEESGEKIKGEYTLELDDDSSDLDSVIFFSKSDNISYLSDKELKEEKINVSQSADFRSLSSFNSSLYFVDEDKNEIVKYPYLGNFEWKNAETILHSDIKIKSIAIDGLIWVLDENNEIKGYYKGEEQKSFKIDTFPEIKNITKIKTRIELPYLYLSEPINNRIIVIDKNGKTIKQFRSDKFDNIKDLSISSNGNIIYILNGTNVYKLSVE